MNNYRIRSYKKSTPYNMKNATITTAMWNVSDSRQSKYQQNETAAG